MRNISFFIPAYNCSQTIAESVDSIMETNFSAGDELIIVNDHSSDATSPVLKFIKDKYPATKIIFHSRNKGGAAARNTAVENSQHELLFCLDADNVLEKNSIAALKKELECKNADIASFQEMRYFNTEDKFDTKYVWRFLPETSLADFMADHKNPGSSGNYLFTKSSWLKAKGYPEFAGALDTWGFCFNQLASGGKLVALPGSYYFHRYGSDSYYIRDMGSRNMSIAALQIILPYHFLVDPDDLDHIMARENRYDWFENLDKRPIRITGSPAGIKSASIYIQQPAKKDGLLKRIYKRLKNTFFMV